MDRSKNCKDCLGASFGDCDKCEQMIKDESANTEDSKKTTNKECKNE